MSLRARLAAGLLAILAIWVLAGIAMVALESKTLVAQVDQQLNSVRRSAVVIASEKTSGGAIPVRNRQEFSDLYLGLAQPGGIVVTLLEPAGSPVASPVLTPGRGYSQPSTVATSGGSGQSMRVIVVAGRDRNRIVVGRSLAEVHDTTRQLIRTLLLMTVLVIGVMALVDWWVVRLGLEPIHRVTVAARAIRAGDRSHRVETFPDGTEAQDLGQAFNLLVERNEHSEAVLRQFVADASHELRTPLTTLSGYASLYADGGLRDPASLDDAMRRIRHEAGRMSRLVDDLLLLADLDKGPTTRTTTADLGGLLQGLASDLRVLDPSRDIHVDVPNPIQVRGDPDQLTQVFAGLVEHARKYTPAGSPIEIHAVVSSEVAHVMVTDHGAGIPTVDVERVFDRFYRSDTARARETGGSGLGLAIARAIVVAHGGRIFVTPTSGGGATFNVALPK
jgi:two-component system OmpR family sensor kinase